MTFEKGAAVFFDPFFRLVDASNDHEARDAAFGSSAAGHLLFVVHIVDRGRIHPHYFGPQTDE
ncbi:BrnT family toxin [Acidithiobacillus sp. MC6.1]|nr:BrnT family toxin [Acidithiobacillus sp. MC6.1]